MTALAIALGVVGLAAVLAAWDASRRRLAVKSAKARAKDVDVVAKKLAEHEAVYLEWNESIDTRVKVLEDMRKDVRAIKDQLSSGRLGR